MNKGLTSRTINNLCVVMAWGGFSVLFLQTACASSDSDPKDLRPRTSVSAGANDQIEEFTRIIDVKLKTEFALAYIGRADAYRRRNEISAAVADYSRAIELKPDYGSAYAWRGYGYAVLRQDDRAAMDFAKAIELDRRDPLPYSCRGLASLARGNYDSAIADFSKAIELKPSNADDYANRALAYCCKNDYGRAIEDYNKAIELRPTDAELYAKRAEAKRGFLKTAMEQVVADVKASERLGGRVDYGLVNEMSRLSGGVAVDVQAAPQREMRVPTPGDTLRRTESPVATVPAPSFKTFETTPMLEKPAGEPVRPPKSATEVKTPPADLTATIDVVVPRLREPADSKVAAAPVVAIPEPPTPAKAEPVPPTVDVTELITKAKENPNLDEQVKLLTKAIQVAPESADAFTARGDTYMMKGDYDLAIKDYSRSIELRPSTGTSYNNRGVAYERKNDYARALQDFDKAVQLNPTLPEAYYNRADANVSLQNFDRAIADFSKAIELKPDDPNTYHGRAIAYYHKRSYD
ncbi:MAG: tetratricopeptide repeat protein, partial [Verrucomicrobiia bacterium]